MKWQVTVTAHPRYQIKRCLEKYQINHNLQKLKSFSKK